MVQNDSFYEALGESIFTCGIFRLKFETAIIYVCCFYDIHITLDILQKLTPDSFYPTALNGCWGIVFTHGVRMVGRAGGRAAGNSLSGLYLRNRKV